MKEFPRRFLSLRDKNPNHRRTRSTPPGNKSRPLTADGFLGIFKSDQSAKSSAKEEFERSKQLNEKIKKVQQALDELHITGVTEDHITDILATDFAAQDPQRAVEFIDIEQKASAGVISPYDPSIHMLGAINRENVTCYLDSLLFAMFAKVEAYESILKTTFPVEDPRHKLVTLLRIWVNMLRTGKLICTDLTKLIQNSLAECGWSDARMLEQQDTSEAFAFITETLQLPLLPLQVDLFHQGKRDDDDHKVVYERLLNLAVPADPDNRGIALEECLEEYFNTQVDVQRDNEIVKKSATDDAWPAMPQRSNTTSFIPVAVNGSEASSPALLRSPRQPSQQSESSQLSEATIQAESSTPTQVSFSEPPAPAEGNSEQAEPSRPRRPTGRARSASVIQSVIIDERGRSKSLDDDSVLAKARRKGSTIVKAVTIPAWQFFRLIPWNAASGNDGPSSNKELFMNFNERPAVGICLKRYLMTENGEPKRHDTNVDIPEQMRLPHFMLAEDGSDETEAGRIASDYKLVLQSVICHRGETLQCGHYFTFARMAPKILKENRRHAWDPPPDYEQSTWVMFDDLAETRVTYIDDIKKAMEDNMPYLLLYQIVPIFDSASSDGEAQPPSYYDSRSSLEAPSESDGHEQSASLRSLPMSHSYFTGARAAAFGSVDNSRPPSIRLSGDFDPAYRKSIDGGSADGFVESRRPSAYTTDSTVGTPAMTPALTPDRQSPAVTPADDMSTGSRLSRAASRFAAGKRSSRPSSQVGENRLSLTINRLGGMMKTASREPSREPLAEPTQLNISATAAPAPAPTSPGPSTTAATAATTATSSSSVMSNTAPSGTAPHSIDDGRHVSSTTHDLTPRRPHHKGNKSKEKSKLPRSADGQPDRECQVM